jgi:hypothetical protein
MDISNVRITKLNQNFAPDPNIAAPRLAISDDDIVLEFPLNYFRGEFADGAIGRLRFRNCLMFRAGDPNDEGFFDPVGKRNASRWNTRDYPMMEYHSLYLIEGVEWKSAFGPHAFVNEALKKKLEDKPMKHFVFLMKDGSFECVAEEYEATIPV